MKGRAGMTGPRAHLAALVLVVAVIACMLGRPAVSAQLSPAAYDLSVIVVSRAPAPTQVALSYVRVIEEERLRAGIGELGERTGVSVSEVQIEEGELERGSGELATAAHFLAPGLMRPERGMLPVGAIMRSLPEWEHMRIVFIPERGEVYSGPGDATGDGFVVHMARRMGAYEYDVEIMRGGTGESEESEPPEREPAAPLLPAIVMGAVPGLALGWLAGERRARGRG